MGDAFVTLTVGPYASPASLDASPADPTGFAREFRNRPATVRRSAARSAISTARDRGFCAGMAHARSESMIDCS